MTPAASLEHLLAAKEIVVCSGAGGVGKTTTAAALATLAATRHAGKVLVLTVDPARRLADALGVGPLGNQAVRVPARAFPGGRRAPRGELWAAMLDTKASWDDLVNRHAPDAVTARRILDNSLYENITGRFVQSHEYIAVERLYDLHCGGTFDLIVVDTPPSRDALDFLDAPERMADFFSSRFLRVLTAPYRSSVAGFASKPFFTVADRVLGSQFLHDITEFFSLFQTMAPGFVERARAVSRLLHDHRTTYAVVTTLEASPFQEASFLMDSLRRKGFHLGAVVLNKVLPAYLLDEAAGQAAAALVAEADATAATLAAAGVGDGDASQVARVLTEVGESFLRFQVVAQREAEHRSELRTSAEVVASVPYFETDIHDLAGLLRLGEQLLAGEGQPPPPAR